MTQLDKKNSFQNENSAHPVDWNSTQNQLLENPFWPEEEREWLRSIFQSVIEKKNLSGHLFVASSGSSQKKGESLKLIALSKKAFLVSAKSVNEHIESTPEDSWLCCLPSFHVGALSIWARAFLLKQKVVELNRWNPESFCRLIEEQSLTLASLVPTQVFDLLKMNLNCPPSLRLIFVGGGAIENEVLKEAQKKGWPLLPTYGMTEVASQIATAELNFFEKIVDQNQNQNQNQKQKQKLKILPHVQASLSSEGRLVIKSEALMTGYGQIIQGKLNWIDINNLSGYETSDLCEIEDGFLIPKGRNQNFIKIFGEGVNLDSLQSRLEFWINDQFIVPAKVDFQIPDLSVFQKTWALKAKPDSRRGFNIYLQTEKADFEKNKKIFEWIIHQWNSKCNPVERIQEIEIVSSLSWKRKV